MILVWEAVHYLHEANYIIDLLNTTAAEFSIKHDQASEPSFPIRISLKVESNSTANMLGDRSFDIELQELCSVPGPSQEYTMLDGMLDQVFIASAPRSLQNVSTLPELATYQVGSCPRNVGVELSWVSL